MTAGNLSFTSVASIPKLQEKTNSKEWPNSVQGFFEINGLWQWILGQMIKSRTLTSAVGKQHAATLKEAKKDKSVGCLILTDSL